MGKLLQRVQRRPAGAFIVTYPEGLGSQNVDTVMCAHCGMHWEPRPGSGQLRGICRKCMGPTCGKGPCETRCEPIGAMIERLEREGAVRLRSAIEQAERANL